MRTNVILDKPIVEQAKALSGIKTTRGVIDEALRMLIRLRQQGEAAHLRSRLRWKGDLAALREGRVDAHRTGPEGPPPMLLVDSSVWVDYCNGAVTPPTDYLLRRPTWTCASRTRGNGSNELA